MLACALVVSAVAGCGGAAEHGASGARSSASSDRHLVGHRHARLAGCIRPVLGPSVRVPSGVAALAMGDRALWVSGFDTVSRLDPRTGRLLSGIKTPGTGDYSHIVVTKRAVWVTATAAGAVYRIDPRTKRVSATVHLGGAPVGVAVGRGGVWVTRPTQGLGQLLKIDTRNDRVTGRLRLGPGPGQVIYGQHALWVQNTSPASLMRVNPVSTRVSTVIGNGPVAAGSPSSGSIAVGYGSLWSAANGSLTRLDPSTAKVIAAVHAPRVVALALGAGEVWALAYPKSSSPNTFDPIKHTAAVWEVDPSSNRVVGKPIRLSALQPIAITAGHTNAWIANYDSQTVTRLDFTSCREGHGR